MRKEFLDVWIRCAQRDHAYDMMTIFKVQIRCSYDLSIYLSIVFMGDSVVDWIFM